MATLNFDYASEFSITGGIFSPVRDVTVITGVTGTAKPRRSPPRDRTRRRAVSRGSSSRQHSPTRSSRSALSGHVAGSTPPSIPLQTHESSSQSIRHTAQGRSGAPSPSSSRLGAMHGLTTPLAPRSTTTPYTTSSVGTVTPAIPRSNEVSGSPWSAASDLHRLPRRDSIGTSSPDQLRPLGPRPLPRIVRYSRIVNPETPYVIGSRSHTPDTTSTSTSWPSSREQLPSLVVSPMMPSSSSLDYLRPHQPIPFSRHSVQFERFSQSPSYATNNGRRSRLSSSQSFSGLEAPFSGRVMPPSSTFRSYSVSQAPPHWQRQAASYNYDYTPSSRRAYWPSSSPSFLGPMASPEMNALSPFSPEYLPRPQSSSNRQGIIHTSSPGVQNQLPDPYIPAGAADLPHASYLQSRQATSYHYGSYDDPLSPTSC